jgi:hypothetical protein
VQDRGAGLDRHAGRPERVAGGGGGGAPGGAQSELAELNALKAEAEGGGSAGDRRLRTRGGAPRRPPCRREHEEKAERDLLELAFAGQHCFWLDLRFLDHVAQAMPGSVACAPQPPEALCGGDAEWATTPDRVAFQKWLQASPRACVAQLPDVAAFVGVLDACGRGGVGLELAVVVAYFCHAAERSADGRVAMA